MKNSVKTPIWRITGLMLSVLTVTLLFQSCAVRAVRKEFFSMDTFMVFSVYGSDETAENAKSEVEKYDEMFSVSSVSGGFLKCWNVPKFCGNVRADFMT